MSDPVTAPAFTPDDLAAARALFRGKLTDCPFCAGFSVPDPRRGLTRADPGLLLGTDSTHWVVRCWSCSAEISGDTAADAVRRWNRRAGGRRVEQEMLHLVDLHSLARKCGIEITPAAEAFARAVQADVLRLNRRPPQ